MTHPNTSATTPLRFDVASPRSVNAAAAGVSYRQATPQDAEAIHLLLRPYVVSRKLFARTDAEVIDLTRHGFIAEEVNQVVGFAAVEVYSRKLAEVQCLAIAEAYQNRGIGQTLVGLCVQRAKDLGVVEVMAISSSEEFLKRCGFDYALPDQKRALFYQLQRRSVDPDQSHAE